jgi:hypothetical protein
LKGRIGRLEQEGGLRLDGPIPPITRDLFSKITKILDTRQLLCEPLELTQPVGAEKLCRCRFGRLGGATRL